MKIKILIIISLLNFYIFSNNYQLLDNNFKIFYLNENNINDIEYITNSSFIFSSKSYPINFYLSKDDGKINSTINVVEEFKKINNIPSDLKIISMSEIFNTGNDAITFYLGTSYGKYNGFYQLNIKNKKLSFFVPKLINYKENIHNLKLDGFPKKDNYIISIIDKKYVFYQEDEDMFDNYQEVYRYNLNTKENKLFNEKAFQSEWVVLDDSLIICAGHPGVLILNSDGVLLQYYSNLFYLSVALSPDKSKIIFNGGLYDKDQASVTDEEGFMGDIKVLTFGLLEFSINQNAKNELIKQAKSIKNIDEKKRLEEITNPDKSKKIFIPYELILTPTVDNLRLRETSDQNGKVIRNLVKGEKLKYVESGKADTIQDIQGLWVKVKTEKGEVGWCFDAYLDEVKKK